MQTDIFDFLDTDVKKSKVEAVAKVILTSDSIRGKLSKAIENKDRKGLINLFKESMRTFGFAGHSLNGYGSWSWNGTELKNSRDGETYVITAKELADVAINFIKGD
ncbi:hypothetical protein HMI01_10980 [Halolactibacillus miurensis]|uniref:Uncharacterized protein n=1 Tax=Halolactibacillus miurensis TaxID=306541 RepID=A0A1I6SGY7_9BACI|nr:hypothetical protein [Halolactibacillus miurensis]GEM04110.1 hypothetical protein HMI01_10980 [Halolactibacillus miurensis]SFS76242.1 hypothetical protein SAMN05421668_10945 [Halolactibacillus miurensis]